MIKAQGLAFSRTLGHSIGNTFSDTFSDNSALI
jgi:hypothetical protein